MSQQHPQHPGYTPPPPKKHSTGKIIGIGCAGIFALLIIIGIFGAALGGDSDDTSSNKASSKPTTKDTTAEETATKDTTPEEEAEEPVEEETSEPPKKKEEKPKVVFKVWGTAPPGALGPLDITYGSDSDNREGAWKDGGFEATLPLNDDALYYHVTAQLQGSGDINCSVTVDGETKKGHASGGYNICSAQANAGLLGGWG